MNNNIQIILVSFVLGIVMLGISYALSRLTEEGRGNVAEGERNSQRALWISGLSFLVFLIFIFKLIASWLPSGVGQYLLIITGIIIALYVTYRIVKSIFKLINDAWINKEYSAIVFGTIYVGLLFFYLYLAIKLIKGVWSFLTSIFN